MVRARSFRRSEHNRLETGHLGLFVHRCGTGLTNVYAARSVFRQVAECISGYGMSEAGDVMEHDPERGEPSDDQQAERLRALIEPVPRVPSNLCLRPSNRSRVN